GRAGGGRAEGAERWMGPSAGSRRRNPTLRGFASGRSVGAGAFPRNRGAAGILFALTDEQKALRELAHEFAEKEIRPRASEYDEQQTHAADVIAKAHEGGLMNLCVPEEDGGPGRSVFGWGLLIGGRE